MKKQHLLQYDKGDPVAKFLVEKMQFTPPVFALTWTLIIITLIFFIALVSGTLFDGPLGPGLMSDWVWWLWSLFFTPVLAGYYLWSSSAIEAVVDGLKRSDILDIPVEDIDAIVGYFEKPWRKILAIGFMVIIGVLYFVTREKLAGFASTTLAAKLGTALTYSILSYFVVVLIANLVINYWAVRRIVQGKEININPLHPDRCGGLKILSDYSIRVVYLNAICGILVSISAYRLFSIGYIWAAIFAVVFYLSIATISFFAPLSTAHDEMLEAKTKLLLSVGRQFWKNYLAAHNSIGGEPDALKAELEKIKQLQELYDLTQNFPVWPFDITTLRRFFITISSPLIPPLVGLLIDAVTKKIFP